MRILYGTLQGYTRVILRHSNVTRMLDEAEAKRKGLDVEDTDGKLNESTKQARQDAQEKLVRDWFRLVQDSNGVVVSIIRNGVSLYSKNSRVVTASTLPSLAQISSHQNSCIAKTGSSRIYGT
jgi:hypothetical protein